MKNREKIRSEKPIEEGKKKTQGVVSGSPDSEGGSREGNAGHQSNPNSGKGHRQV